MSKMEFVDPKEAEKFKRAEICAYQLRRSTSLVHILYFLYDIVNHSGIFYGQE